MAETKEEFCGACIAGVAALVGSGAAGSSTKDRKKNKKKKQIIFWVSVALTVVSIIFMIYYLWIKKCEECA